MRWLLTEMERIYRGPAAKNKRVSGCGELKKGLPMGSPFKDQGRSYSPTILKIGSNFGSVLNLSI